METRDIAILLIALLVVVVLAVVVKPAITGENPDLSLPFLPGSPSGHDSSPSITQDFTPAPTPGKSDAQTPEPMHTWNGSPVEFGYIGDATPVLPQIPGDSRDSPQTYPAGAPETPQVPGILTASFSASPTEGSLPLPVTFTDTSTGVPEKWKWSFGDGITSTDENPLHTYTTEGRFSVSLTVENEYGANTRINQGLVTVTPAGRKDVALHAPRGASIAPGGFVEFTVIKPASRIKIAGVVEELPVGGRIRLVVDDPGKGKIAMRKDSIQDYSFEKVILYIDGELRQRGVVREINVQGYEGLISSLELRIAGGEGEIDLLENGRPVAISGKNAPLSLISLRPDSSGIMILDCYWPDVTSFQGAVTSYHAEEPESPGG